MVLGDLESPSVELSLSHVVLCMLRWEWDEGSLVKTLGGQLVSMDSVHSSFAGHTYVLPNPGGHKWGPAVCWPAPHCLPQDSHN